MTLPWSTLGEGGLWFYRTPSSVALSVVLLLGVAAVCVAGWWRSGWRPAYGALELLRFVIAALVVALLNQPEWVTQQRPTHKPTVSVLIDGSPSMATVDEVRGGGSAVARRDAAAALADPAFWQPLAQRFDVRVERFDAGAEGSPARATDLFAPLDAAPRREPHLRAVVLASDGDWTAGPPPVQAAAALRLAGVPVLAVPLGSAIPLPDVELAALDCPTIGVAGKPIRIPFTVRSTMPREQSVPVTIQVSDGQSFSRVVRAPALGKASDWVFWTPAATGDFTVTARVPPQPGELVPDNNTRSAPIGVRQERLRVLVVESQPRWEYRYLRNALSRDPGVEVSCLLFHPSLGKVGGGSKDYLKKFPATPEELAPYDVVFLGDVGIAAGQLTEEDARLLRGLVEYQASGLVFLPGWLGNVMTLQGSPLGDLLPVVLDGARPEGTGGGTPGRFALTEVGRKSLLTRLADSAEENVEVWDGLPGFQWYGPVLRASAGSEVLAVHADASNEYGRVPLLVTRTFGAGKVLFMATDGAWRWRKGVEDKYHYRFWGQVVRWMAYRRNMARGERMRLLFSPEQPEPGQTVTLDANVTDSTGEPLQAGTVTVAVVDPTGAGETVRLAAPGEQGAWGVFSGSWTPRTSGAHALTLACAQTGDRLETSIFVQGVVGETIGNPARPDVLEEIARLTRGSVTAPHELQNLLATLTQLPDNPPEVRRLKLWAHPVVLVTLVTLLGLFWVGRKWQGFI